MPRCVTSCGTRTACPGQPESTLTAAGLRPYRSKALRHKLVPDAVLTAFRPTEGKMLCRHSVQKSTPSRRIQVEGRSRIRNLATKVLFRTHSYLRRAYNPYGRCCSANVSAELQHALSRRGPKAGFCSTRRRSTQTVRSGASHPIALLRMSMFGK